MSGNVSLHVLDSISIASPCSMKWEDMEGDNRVRHCGHCNLNVYNLSEMTREEGEQLVRSSTERLCGRLYRRADGTVLTADCPVGLAGVRHRAIKLATRLAAAAFTLLTGGILLGDRSQPRVTASLGEREPFSVIREWLRPIVPMPVAPSRMGKVVMGDMICPPSRAPLQPQSGTIPGANQGVNPSVPGSPFMGR